MYRQYGFESARGGLARSADEAAKIASEIGYPVALKIASPDIVHKTEIGGVSLNLMTSDEVSQTFECITASVRAACPKANVKGVEVQEMLTHGVEIIIGLLDDLQFGPVIMFGLGGIFTEVLREVSFRVLPIEPPDAAQMIREVQCFKILQGYRGQPPVSGDMLVDLLLKANHMGIDLEGSFESIDFNPIVVWEDQHRVLDAKILWHPQTRPVLPVSSPNPKHLEKLFKAESVAVVGASATPRKVGNALLDSLLNHDYRGKVYPVNPARDEIMGAKCYPSLAEIPGPVDLVVVTADLHVVPDVIKACATKGIHDLLIISGGGKEVGSDGAKLETEIRRLAHAHDVRVIGPNCIGMFDGQTRMQTFFQPYDQMLRPKAGRVAMLTQSGTIGAIFLEDAVDLGVSKLVSYGNRCDVDEADLLVYLANDIETDVIALYVEGFEDGRKFLTTAREVSQKKPIVIFKAGRTERGARASVSHTGYHGGSYDVVQGALKQAGLIAVDSFEELFATSKALVMQPRARGARVGMISNGAGTMGQAIDLLKSYDLEMPELGPESVRKLRHLYPPFYLVQNPLDITGSANGAEYEVGIETLMQDPQVDIIMPWFCFTNAPVGPDIVQGLVKSIKV